MLEIIGVQKLQIHIPSIGEDNIYSADSEFTEMWPLLNKSRNGKAPFERLRDELRKRAGDRVWFKKAL
jgi:hypothetical protein